MADIFEQLNKSFNDNPWHADDESSISLRRIHGRGNVGKRLETVESSSGSLQQTGGGVLAEAETEGGFVPHGGLDPRSMLCGCWNYRKVLIDGL